VGHRVGEPGSIEGTAHDNRSAGRQPAIGKGGDGRPRDLPDPWDEAHERLDTGRRRRPAIVGWECRTEIAGSEVSGSEVA
jgi:hypothetical protein